MMKPLEARNEKYEPTERQQRLNHSYVNVVDLLNKAGYKATYQKFWMCAAGDQPGYIQLEDDNHANAAVQQHTSGS